MAAVNVAQMEQLITVLIRAQVLVPTIVEFVGWMRRALAEAQDETVLDDRDGTEYESREKALAAGVPEANIKSNLPTPAEMADMIDRIAADNADLNRSEIERLKAKLAEQGGE